MGAEDELLRRLQEALARTDLEATTVVDEAWGAARAEVLAVLQRAFQHELLSRVTQVLDDELPRGVPRQRPEPSPEGHEPSPARREPSPASREPSPDAETAAGPDAPVAASADDVATYVFGFTRASVTLDAELPGIPGGGPVRSVRDGSLLAIVCDVDPGSLRVLEELAPDDLDRLAAVAHVHDEVLASAAAQEPVLPLRFGTVLADDGVVRALLTANSSALTAELDRVEGHAEWAVVVHLPERGATTPAPGAAPAPDAAADSGGDYLRGRRAELQARERRWEARDRLVAELHQRLSSFAVAAEVVDRPPLQQVPPALHGVYLLAWDAIGPFEDAVDEARRTYPDAVIEATGPWPPYHFTSVDLSLDGHGSP
jgi:hypothetical protein